MLKISTRILNKIKDQTPKSVFTKAFSENNNNSTINNSNNNNNNNNIENNNENDEKSTTSTPNILFSGGKVNRTYNRYEFSSEKKPIRTASNKQREEIKKHQNEIEEKNRETKKAMVEHHIRKDPKKKEVYEKFYQDYREKEIEQKIHVELSSRDNDRIYDEITLDEPINPEQQLKLLLDQIKIDKKQILNNKQQLSLMESISSNALTQSEIDEINEKVSIEFERAKKLYIAGNHKESFNIFEKLSTQYNHGMSNVFLGNMYYIGSSVTDIDYHQSFQHFYSAATSFKIPVAFGMIGELIFRGLVNEVDGKPIGNDIERDNYVKVYFNLASQFGLKSSTEQLAFIYMNDRQKNLNGAIQMLKRLAIRNNDINAITTIGALLLDDHPIVSKDLWLFASKMGDSNAQTQLGRYYYHHSSNPDYNNALLLWTSASKKGDKDAQFYLGGMYNIGLVVEKSITKSLQLYELSAKGGNSNAQFLIGKAYLNGEGITQNIELGNYYLKQSANQNNETAINYLNELENNQDNQDNDDIKK